MYFVGLNRGYNPAWRNHPNLSYQSNKVENPHDQVYPKKPQGNFNGRYQGRGNFQLRPQFNNQQATYQPPPFQPPPNENKIEVIMKQLMHTKNQF